jgi:hypothetical protein
MLKISLSCTDILLLINKLCKNNKNLKNNYKFLKRGSKLYKKSYKKYKFYKKIKLKEKKN